MDKYKCKLIFTKLIKTKVIKYMNTLQNIYKL